MGKEFSTAKIDDDITGGGSIFLNSSTTKSSKPTTTTTTSSSSNPRDFYQLVSYGYHDPDDFNFNVTECVKELSSHTNYGVLPISVLHNLFLFGTVKDVGSAMRTCSLFYEIINTQLFWREYCLAWKKNGFTKREEKKVKNWKLEFFNYFFTPNNDDNFIGKYDVRKMGNSKDENQFFPAKICVIGDESCGKTSLIKRWEKGDFDNKIEGTIGAAFSTIGIKRNRDNHKIKFQLWDTAGNERYQSIITMYYRGASAIVFCFSLNCAKSFKKLGEIIDTAMKNYLENSEFMLIGTKCDLEREVKRIEITNFLKKYPKIRSYVETSSKTKINIVSSMCILFEIIALKEQMD